MSPVGNQEDIIPSEENKCQVQRPRGRKEIAFEFKEQKGRLAKLNLVTSGRGEENQVRGEAGLGRVAFCIPYGEEG